MCQTASIIIGSGLIFTAGVLYGLMALGKKSVTGDVSVTHGPSVAVRPFLPWVVKYGMLNQHI